MLLGIQGVNVVCKNCNRAKTLASDRSLTSARMGCGSLRSEVIQYLRQRLREAAHEIGVPSFSVVRRGNRQGIDGESPLR
jgi:hypothetical protein